MKKIFILLIVVLFSLSCKKGAEEVTSEEKLSNSLLKKKADEPPYCPGANITVDIDYMVENNPECAGGYRSYALVEVTCPVSGESKILTRLLEDRWNECFNPGNTPPPIDTTSLSFSPDLVPNTCQGLYYAITPDNIAHFNNGYFLNNLQEYLIMVDLYTSVFSYVNTEVDLSPLNGYNRGVEKLQYGLWAYLMAQRFGGTNVANWVINIPNSIIPYYYPCYNYKNEVVVASSFYTSATDLPTIVQDLILEIQAGRL